MTELGYFEEWLVGREWKPGELSSIIALPSRGLGKSVFRELYMQQPIPLPKITGTTANTIVADEVSSFTIDKLRKAISRVDHIWLDEADLVTPMPVEQTPYVLRDDVRASFKDEEFPEADTFVVLEKLDRKDPRHPNPAAGDVRHWFVLQGHKKMQAKNLSQAKRRAEQLHLQTIARIKKEREDAAHQARLAREEELRLAAANEAHLKAHPAFGGF
ncbi:hypothetical protein GFL39_26290 [Rhizobium leguminosarum bv. viciae]|uniref:hypothetical protein n=1 Tax=Rhizobium leguminosarum TaxID=384 RepID=UPI001441B42B|nr:hypothetical protein [Rhizobium leguminosarum]NKL08382.1 hypothetical protein [Rhizobium leguminosarum bv. viciae]